MVPWSDGNLDETMFRVPRLRETLSVEKIKISGINAKTYLTQIDIFVNIFQKKKNERIWVKE